MIDITSSSAASIDELISHRGPLPPGRHLFSVDRTITIDVELASGGGGGGGAVDTPIGWASSGEGGCEGQYSFAEYTLEPCLYLIEVGVGGAGGASLGRTQHAPAGADGGHTILTRYRVGLPIAFLHGGIGGRAGGRGAGGGTSGGDGADLINPQTGYAVGKGGRGGAWMSNGEHASGHGAGGGGEGGARLPGGHGGSGAGGFAKFTKVG